MDPSESALFRAFPRLRGALPHTPLLPGPTPVEPLPLPGLPAGSLFVKRDDRSTPHYGGNKPRKLEFLLGRALARGARRLVTTGGIGTNHGLATTILARQVDLATTLVLVDQPVTDEVREKIGLCAAYGAEVVYARTVPRTAAHVLRVLARASLRGERPYLVPTGGSSPTGNLGFVAAALELAEQVKQGACPAPGEIWAPVGTGGTVAGLAVGLGIAGLPTRVRGVLVTDILAPSPARLAGMARRTLRRLRRADPDVPEVPLSRAAFALVTDQVGPGYGAATPAGRDAVALAAGLGLSLETTYTGKSLAALCARLDGPAPRERPILFWNTYNGVDLRPHAPRPPSPELLPRALQRRLAAVE